MTRLQLTLGVAMCLAITVGSAVVHGRITGRWGTSDTIRETAECLETLPERIGPWKMMERQDFGETELGQLQPYGYVSRVYENLNTRERVTFFVLMGPVGPTAVHTPEICMSSGFSVTEQKTQTELRSGRGKADTFWTMTFRSKGLEQGLRRVYFGWSDGSTWQASTGTRYKFAGLPFLYKIQLAADLPAGGGTDEGDPCQRFMSDLLPVLQDHLSLAK